jgi:putative permease
MSSYIKGKFYEIIVVAIVSYLVFLALGLRFAALLAAGAGLSVLIPLFGAPLAGVPVAIVAYAQWGLGDELAWTMIAYTVIQVLDGSVLSALLLAGAVRLHPIAVIAATLVFEELWGFWGLFFAVPLASLVQVVLDAWPRDWHQPEDIPAPLKVSEAFRPSAGMSCGDAGTELTLY